MAYFNTGFDGLTKTSLTYSLYRIWCGNGAGHWEEQSLSFKNTFRNHTKGLAKFCDEINTMIESVETYTKNLTNLTTINITQRELNDFISKLTGYSMKDYEEMKGKKRGIIDRINESMAIEISNTGANLYSVLNGVTRYTTHYLAEGDENKIYYSPTVIALNNRAHKLVGL